MNAELDPAARSRTTAPWRASARRGGQGTRRRACGRARSRVGAATASVDELDRFDDAMFLLELYLYTTHLHE